MAGIKNAKVFPVPVCLRTNFQPKGLEQNWESFQNDENSS